ncbi:SsgA family sporulation/cell division regulator [Streptomyces sp. NPDC051020]|uniref:SsgA family sporulation/cell division regulator n=1 Tax=Streptomyces sp. NPDC051020 TaxID=3155409 RepID=UPI0034390836
MEQPLFLHLILEGDQKFPLPARLVYDACQPFTARLDLSHGDVVISSWLFARDLLQAGLRVPSGG